MEAPKAETKYIYLSGSASGSAPEPEVEGDDMEDLDLGTAHTLVIENFDSVVKNKPLSLDSWVNLATTGTRAWWGYTFDDDNNGAAKATLYDSKADDEEEAGMQLFSPLLDFKNAASKILTFRVMGDFLPQDTPYESPLSVLIAYWDEEDEDFYGEPLSGFDFPLTADQNGDWQDYVVDFEGLDMPDTFFIVFNYFGKRGRNNSAVYYIDDFSWGRTDVPQIKVSHTNLIMEGNLNSTAISEDIEVTGKNLKEEIALAMSGAHASKFSTSTATLPAEGGKFAVHFTPEEEGDHSAYVELKSAAAPTMLIPVYANAINPSGIADINAEARGTITYNLQGMRVTRPTGFVIRRDADGRYSKTFVK